jgi:hypothetical protein
MKKVTLVAASVGAALACAVVPASLNWSTDRALLSIDKTEAKVGRPLTPGSVAGVNRRVNRRAYYGAGVGVAGGAAVVGGATVVGGGGVVVAPAPYIGPDLGYGPGPVPGSVIVNPVTGRWCTFEPSGWQWCWRP